jgi:hypothetical protein
VRPSSSDRKICEYAELRGASSRAIAYVGCLLKVTGKCYATVNPKMDLMHVIIVTRSLTNLRAMSGQLILFID